MEMKGIIIDGIRVNQNNNGTTSTNLQLFWMPVNIWLFHICSLAIVPKMIWSFELLVQRILLILGVP